MAVKVDGIVYGKGYISNTPTATERATRGLFVAGLVGLLVFFLFINRSWIVKLLSGRKKGIDSLESSFGEAIYKPDDEETVETEEQESKVHTAAEYEEKEAEVEHLKQQISQERVKHQLERIRKDEYIKQLEKRIESKEVLEQAARDASLSYSS